MHRLSGAVACVVLACSGCARHALQDWRLVKQGSGHVLIPPDVAKADVAQRSFKTGLAVGHGTCPAEPGVIAVKVRGNQARLTVKREALSQQSTGWLASWATQLEQQHCVAPGDGVNLASRITELVPLDPAIPFRLMYPDARQAAGVDLDGQTRLQVLSPVWRDPKVGMVEGPLTVTGTDNQLTITGKSTDNLLGYEKSLYAVQPKAGGAGFTITPVSAERHIQGTTERSALPAVNYFQFPREAGFYRMFYESWQNEFTALVIGARTPVELDERAKKLEAAGTSASCETLNGEMCVTVPRDVGLNPMIAVTVNGEEVLVRRGATVGQAMGAAGERKPETVLGKLSVSKAWNGRMVAVSFETSDEAILRLILSGGEVIRWQ